MDRFWIAAVIILVFIGIAVCRLLKKKAINDVYTYMNNKQFDKCFEIMDKSWCKIAFSGFEYVMLRMDVSMASGSKERVEQCMEKLDTAYMNKKRREQILYMAMTYYVENEDRERCEWVLAQLEKIKSGTVYNEALKLFHVFVLKDGHYIEEMEEEFNRTDDVERKIAMASFLVMQYENVGNRQQMNKYKDILKKYQKEKK